MKKNYISKLCKKSLFVAHLVLQKTTPGLLPKYEAAIQNSVKRCSSHEKNTQLILVLSIKILFKNKIKQTTRLFYFKKHA